MLIRPEKEKDRTPAGLYLPQGVETKEKVQGGFVEKVGPGYPLPDPNAMNERPWETSAAGTSYLPLQAQEGDYALFLRKAAIDVEIDKEEYVIVPQAALLLLVREDILDKLEDPDQD